MKMNEYDYYNSLANWSFDDIECDCEYFTNWIYEDKIRKHTNNNSRRYYGIIAIKKL